MHRIADTNVVFIHIPKTAGQAIKAAFGIKNETHAHSINAAIDKTYIEGDYIRFCVVRDPVRRFVSAWRYNVLHAQRTPTGVRKVLIDNNLLTDINEFTQFADSSDFKPHRYDHFKRQVYFLKKTRPQIILRQETLDRDIGIIRALAPAAYRDLGEKNVSGGRTGIADTNHLLSEESEAIVRKLYARDIDVLGY